MKIYVPHPWKDEQADADEARLCLDPQTKVFRSRLVEAYEQDLKQKDDTEETWRRKETK